MTFSIPLPPSLSLLLPFRPGLRCRSFSRLWPAALLICALGQGFWPAGARAEESVISALEEGDLQYLQNQRQRIDDLARRHLGRQLQQQAPYDLQILQDLLERRIVASGDSLLLQAMGVVLGDLYVAELGLHWVILQDKLGRSRALRWKEEPDLLFPITMISRRVEAGSRVDIAAVYQSGYERMLAVSKRPPTPPGERLF